MRRHARAGGGALLVLHDLVIAAGACDRLALLVGGRTAAEGTPAQVLRPEVLGEAYGTRVDVVAFGARGLPAGQREREREREAPAQMAWKARLGGMATTSGL